MSNRYHNEFHHSSDSHFGSQFSVGSSRDVKVDDGSVYGSRFDLDHHYEGHYVPPNDVGMYHDEDERKWEEAKYCACTIL
ncbi:hypothetical protein Zmor_022247 [Zophobas morio]|uniref:Uncharacterized protein n=1 Tax=Zophobas morio TaxID=2755281 RepID=A0AA38HWL8_9CUCU|nr:hypothetical protein Zmor_022247 [Zophobas morio]